MMVLQLQQGAISKRKFHFKNAKLRARGKIKYGNPAYSICHKYFGTQFMIIVTHNFVKTVYITNLHGK